MALDASEILGSPQLAGCRVNPRGSNKATMRNVGMGEGLGGALAGAIAGKKVGAEPAQAAASVTPSFTMIAWLVLTASELALVSIDRKRGLSLDQILARVPRTEINSVELGKAAPMVSKPLTVTFTSGDYWIVEVPALAKGDVKKIADAFA
ncbi:MAG TPA: hypothetical protein VHV79_10760 [Mycobacteriales bacterium]|jgi:hypothetical protein|nr:hypothetical protein [Mycobacteriales bacterium]